ncbi:alpha/beta fold hydrolase [Gallaecimonas xiamenensis]|uniref:Hydrolase of the alpha/beta-hydrolase fold protein n=1 Tax=Gallaecimonas xiamenensis 3-C-1 TaxID=745411 RepID=K2IKD5_9GAMM|nr:alpha/beta fold hydrolase [Gallaecimonas xiamenensis]EKE70601.1 hydrolase of the alpha/beta-hydrolase fold protein [Gallaecimonas xiamenensis 3-C-1]
MSQVKLVLAHGSGAGQHHPFMQQVKAGLVAAGIEVRSFDFPYMQKAIAAGKPRPPDKMPVLVEAMAEQCRGLEGPLFLAGKSLGARVAMNLAAELCEAGQEVKGVIALGYPFHPPGKPERLRLEPIEKLPTPALILQGERDTFGARAEVAGYGLKVPVQFLPDGDHSFKPRKTSGHSEAGNLAMALTAMLTFIQEHS